MPSRRASTSLCQRRKTLGLTQQQLSEKAGVGRRFIVDLEAGHSRAELTETAWWRFAHDAELDSDHACAQAFAVIQAVSDRYVDVFAPHTDTTRLQRIAKRVRVLQRTIPQDARSLKLDVPVKRADSAA